MANQTKVLIVEDTPAVLNLMSRIIQIVIPTSHVLTANDGKEGLITALKYHPDLIITDLDTPEIDGNEMVRLLRQEKRGKQMLIIGMSGSDPNEAKAANFRMLCDAFLYKPFSLAELREKVASLLGSESPPQPG